MRLYNFRAVGLALFVALVVGALSLWPVARAHADGLPPLSGYTLNGAAVTLPEGLEDGPRLVILSFDGLREEEAAPWRAAAERLGVGHLTLLVMGDRGRIERVALGGRLRGDAPASAPRDFIVPVFASVAAVRSSLGITAAPGELVVAALVDRRGRLWARSAAAPTPETEQLFAAALLDIRKGAAPPASRATTRARPGLTVTAKDMQGAPTALSPGLALQLAPFTRPAIGGATLASAAKPAAPPQPAPTLAAPTANATGFPIMTLAGASRTAPGTDRVVALATGADRAGELVEVLARLEKEGACAGGCLGLVAMGRTSGPARAIAAGRLRADIPDSAMRARIAPVYQEADALLAAFGSAWNGPAVAVVRLKGG